MDVKIEQSWKDVLSGEFEKEYFKKLTDFVRAEYLSGKIIYPEPKNIFNAFNLCPLDKVKVVIRIMNQVKRTVFVFLFNQGLICHRH